MKGLRGRVAALEARVDKIEGRIGQRRSSTEHPFCDFCGKDEKEVRTLIAGPSAFICNECVSLCVDILFRRETAA